MWTREFIIFILCGGVAAVANIGTRRVFSIWMPYAPAICLAYIVGLITAFVLFKKYAFKVNSGRSARNLYREIISFILVNGVALIQTLGISLFFANYVLPDSRMILGREDMAHIVGVSVPLLTSYLGHKFFTFKKRA